MADKKKEKDKKEPSALNKFITRVTGADKVKEGFADSPPNAPGKDPGRPPALDDPNSETEAERQERLKKKKK